MLTVLGAVVLACWVASECLTLCNPKYCSPPGSSVHGILQAVFWNRLPCLPSGDLLDPGIKLSLLCLLHWQVGSLPLVPPGKPRGSGNTKFLKVFLDSEILSVNRVGHLGMSGDYSRLDEGEIREETSTKRVSREVRNLHMLILDRGRGWMEGLRGEIIHFSPSLSPAGQEADLEHSGWPPCHICLQHKIVVFWGLGRTQAEVL